MKLTEPAIEYAQQIQAYRKEFLDCGDSMDGTSSLRRFENSQEWIEYINAHKDPLTGPDGHAPASQFIFIREEDLKIVGMINIRFRLNDYLEKFGGHIGYSVAPSERRKGYATQMLKLVLSECAKLGIGRVLITCVQGNEGSKRTILHNGGVFESTVFDPEDDCWLERYWIDLSR